MSKNIKNVNDLLNSNVHAKEYYLTLSEGARGNVNLHSSDIRSLEEFKTFSENIRYHCYFTLSLCAIKNTINIISKQKGS